MSSFQVADDHANIKTILNIGELTFIVDYQKQRFYRVFNDGKNTSSLFKRQL
jgi:hypothetical protein